MPRISQLAESDTITGTEIVPVVQDGVTRRTTVSGLFTPSVIYETVKLIFQDGEGIQITPDDGESELTISLDGVVAEISVLGGSADTLIGYDANGAAVLYDTGNAIGLLGLSGIESLIDVVENDYVPLKRSGAYVSSPITIDANDVINFTGNGPTSFSHSISVSGDVALDSASYTPTSTGSKPSHTNGRFYYDSGYDALVQYTNESGTDVLIGQMLVDRVRNVSGGTLTKGQVVYFSGASGNRPTVALARADAADTSRTLGIVLSSSITNNANGWIVKFGTVYDQDTSAFADGDLLYLSAATGGDYTTTKPAYPNYAVVVGRVTRSHATAGQIELIPYELTENITAGYVAYASGDGRPKGEAGFEYNDTTDVLSVPLIDVAGRADVGGHLRFTSGAGFGVGTDRWVGSDGANNMFYNVPTGKKHLFAIAGTNTMEISTSVVAVTGAVSATKTTATSPLTVAYANSSTSALTGTHTYLVNTDTTDNNWAHISFADAAGGAASGVFGFQFTNHTNYYGQFAFYTREADGFLKRANISGAGLVVTGAISATTGVTVATGQDVLANYKEDTYTATLTCGTSGTVTLNSIYDTLSYTRVGNMVHVQGYLECSSISSPLGDLLFNLPFTSANPTELSGRVVGSVTVINSATKNANSFGVYIEEASSSANIVLIDGTALSVTTAPEMTATTALIFGFSYQV